MADLVTAGVADLVARLKAVGPSLVVLEATGGYEAAALAALLAAGVPAAVVNPRRVRQFASGIGQHAKTDPIDAAVIAHFAQATEPEVRVLPDEATRLLADLVSRRRQIVEMIGAESQRETRAVDKRLKNSIARLKKALEKELVEIDGEIDDNTRGREEWREKEELLRSVPGVGRVIARTLLCELPELGRVDGKKIASLVGLAPWTRKSGKWQGKSMIGGGRASTRAVLFMGAMVAKKHNPLLKAFFDRLVARGKPKLLALIAVARKLVTMLNAMVRDNKKWTQELAHAQA